MTNINCPIDIDDVMNSNEFKCHLAECQHCKEEVLATEMFKQNLIAVEVDRVIEQLETKAAPVMSFQPVDGGGISASWRDRVWCGEVETGGIWMF
jgi:hypothetical protein